MPASAAWRFTHACALRATCVIFTVTTIVTSKPTMRNAISQGVVSRVESKKFPSDPK
ncbi:hypothetical protein D3C83_325370 [compost metagenome]